MEDVERFRTLAYAPATQKTYKTQRESYLRFCSAMGYCPVPASTQTICRYVALLARTHKFSSIKQYMNIIRILHLEWDLPNPLADNYHISSVLKGIRRDLGDNPINRKLPMTPNILMRILCVLDLSDSAHCTFWAACLVMFYGMLRRSNVMPSSSSTFEHSKHLRRQDIRFTANNLIIIIRWSKTIQFRQRILTLPLPRILSHPLCPLQATFKAFQRTCSAPPTGPAFIISESPPYQPLTVNNFNQILRQSLMRIGLDPTQFTSHSFRRGGASWAYQNDVPVDTIKTIGDWRSNAYQRYVIDSSNSINKAMQKVAQSVHDTVQ